MHDARALAEPLDEDARVLLEILLVDLDVEQRLVDLLAQEHRVAPPARVIRLKLHVCTLLRVQASAEAQKIAATT